jgi:hypothetical protein
MEKLVSVVENPSITQTITILNPDGSPYQEDVPVAVYAMPVESGSTNYLEYEDTAASQSINPEYFIEYAYTEGYQLRIWPRKQQRAYSGGPVIDPDDPYDITLKKKTTALLISLIRQNHTLTKACL